MLSKNKIFLLTYLQFTSIDSKWSDQRATHSNVPYEELELKGKNPDRSVSVVHSSWQKKWKANPIAYDNETDNAAIDTKSIIRIALWNVKSGYLKH